MRLASFRYADRERIGLLKNDQEINFIDGFNSMRDLIRSGEDAGRFISRSVVSVDDVDWLTATKTVKEMDAYNREVLALE